MNFLSLEDFIHLEYKNVVFKQLCSFLLKAQIQTKEKGRSQGLQFICYDPKYMYQLRAEARLF